MISEKKFAAEYSSFWQHLLPMSEHVVRRLNLGQIERFAPPIALRAPAGRRGLINELAFFCFRFKEEKQVATIEKADFANLEEKARKRISQLDGLTQAQVPKLVDAEKAEVEMLAENATLFLAEKVKDGGKVVVSPQFKGCGIVDSCEGDIFTGKTLVELKAGDRKFRSLDFRQIFTYGALNYAAGTFDILNFCLMNPRHGTFLVLSVDEAAQEFAGVRPSQMYEEILQYISSGGVSK